MDETRAPHELLLQTLLAIGAVGFAASLFEASVGFFVPNPVGRAIALAMPVAIMAAMVVGGRLARSGRPRLALVAMTAAALPGLATILFTVATAFE